MNIITYNVRGLGRGVKWPTIRRMVNKLVGGGRMNENAIRGAPNRGVDNGELQ